jgi:hypothetical protein
VTPPQPSIDAKVPGVVSALSNILSRAVHINNILGREEDLES